MGALINSQEAKRNCGTLEEEKEGNIALRIINTYPKASVIEIVNYFCSNRKNRHIHLVLSIKLSIIKLLISGIF